MPSGADFAGKLSSLVSYERMAKIVDILSIMSILCVSVNR